MYPEVTSKNLDICKGLLTLLRDAPDIQISNSTHG